MKKSFCDMCGLEVATAPRTVTSVPIGKPYSATKVGSGSGCVDGNWQTRIDVSVSFQLKDPKEGPERQPDICAACRDILIDKLKGLE